MNKTDGIVLGILFLLLAAIPGVPILYLGIDTGPRTHVGVPVKTSSTTFPWHETTITFVISAPDGTILQETYDRTYEGIITLELGKACRISAYKDAFHLHQRIIKIETVPTFDGGAWYNP